MIKYNELITLDSMTPWHKVVVHLPLLKLYRLKHYPIQHQSIGQQKSLVLSQQKASITNPHVLRIHKVYWNHPENHYSVLFSNRHQISLQEY